MTPVASLVSRRLPLPALVLAIAAASKSLLGLVGLLRVSGGNASTIPAPVYAVMLAAFLLSGSALAWGGRRDRRAFDLGACFLVIGSTFADRGIAQVELALFGTGVMAATLRHVCLETWSPWLLWSFVRRFPRGSLFGRTHSLWRTGHDAALSLGGSLFLLQLLAPAIRGDAGALSPLLDSLYRHGSNTLYWALILGLQGSAIGFAVWRSRGVRVEERRRVRILLAGLAAASLPLTAVAILGAAWPGFEVWVTAPANVRALGWIIYPSLLVLPLAAWYAVVVDRALEVRLIVRNAVRYAVARGTVLTAIGLPAGLLVLILYQRRGETVSALFTGPGAPAALLTTGVAWMSFRSRRRLLDAVDRAFFREQYDARVTLSRLIVASRDAADPSELGALILGQLDRALHVGPCHLVAMDPASGLLVSASTGLRPLRPDGAIGAALSSRRGGATVEWDNPRAWTRRLPDTESLWLADSGARLIVGLKDQNGRLIGALTVGDKRSELPYSREDRELVDAIAGTASLALDRWLVARTLESAEPEAQVEGSGVAMGCAECGRVARKPGACRECGGRLDPLTVPAIVGGQYKLERRIGSGGMGVVYRAVDVELGRAVALKTLPRMRPEYAHRLRREARAVASLSHPHIASIFDFESWNGVPILVFEYLEGGTLADRLGDGPLPVPEALRIGIDVATGLAAHADGVLHRDVKPSNIGFTRHGVPKLVDLGIAVVAGAADDEGWHADGAGTPAYMSPEAIDGTDPGPTFDVWGLTVTLYEAIAGRNPFAAATRAGVLARIVTGPTPDLGAEALWAPPSVVTFFGRALSRNPQDRPATSEELRRRLAGLS
jgi:hypothetical protein